MLSTTFLETDGNLKDDVSSPAPQDTRSDGKETPLCPRGVLGGPSGGGTLTGILNPLFRRFLPPVDFPFPPVSVGDGGRGGFAGPHPPE